MVLPGRGDIMKNEDKLERVIIDSIVAVDLARVLYYEIIAGEDLRDTLANQSIDLALDIHLDIPEADHITLEDF